MPGRSGRRIATVVLALAAVVVGCVGFVSASTIDIRVYDAGVGPPGALPGEPSAGLSSSVASEELYVERQA